MITLLFIGQAPCPKKSIIQIKNQMQEPYLHDYTIRLSIDRLKDKGQMYVLSKTLPFSGNVSDPRREILQILLYDSVDHSSKCKNVSYKYAPLIATCLVIYLLKISYSYRFCS